MIRENQKVLNFLNLLTDAAAIILAMIAAYLLRFYVFHGEPGELRLGYYLTAVLAIAPFLIFIYGLFGMYESFRTRTFQKELEMMVKSNVIGTILLISFFFIFKNIEISRWAVALFFFTATAAVALKRYALRQILRRYRARGYNKKHFLLIGSGAIADRYAQAVKNNPALGISISGCVTDGVPPPGIPLRGGFDRLEQILLAAYFDEAVAALSLDQSAYTAQVIAACEKSGVKLSLIPYFAELMPAHPYIDELGGLPLLNIRRIPLDNMASAFVKRAEDLLGSLLLLIITSPLLLFAALGTKLSSPGPVIFRQTRVGRNKKNFTMYKFRSMRVNAQADTAWSTDRDPRKTKFGSLLRKCSIDELPQLMNVFKGDMSLVGPRPELPYFVEQFKQTIPLYMVKHQVRPGITGWAQVNGFRGDTSIEERIRCDIYYIENWSLLLDIRILLRTVLGGLVNDEKTA